MTINRARNHSISSLHFQTIHGRNNADLSATNLQVTHLRTDQLFFEDFAPNLHTTFPQKISYFLQIIKYDVTKSNKTRMDTEIASTRNEITIHFICMTQKCKANTKISVQRHILKLSLLNLQYANDGPLLLAVIPGGKVQDDKNLAGFHFAGGSILFNPYKLQKFPESG